jgi:uncharacterized protein YpmB
MGKIILLALTIILSLLIMQNTPKEKALEIAEQECNNQGWKFEDVSVTDEKDKWFVMTNKFFRGGNALIYIDKKTGKIINKKYNPK